MAKYAVVKSGGKQYLVKANDEIIVDKVKNRENESVNLETIAIFDDENSTLEVGTPILTSSIKATVIGDIKGEKVRISRFKSKVRTRKTTGFRAQLTKLKIGSI